MRDISERCGTLAGRRAASYWFVDRLPEIVTGASFVLLGCVSWWMLDRSHPWMARMVATGLALVLMALVFGWERTVARYLKARLTYPRTGYVRPPEPAGNARQTEVIVSLGLGQRPLPDENVTSFCEHTVVVLFFGRLLFSVVGQPWGLPFVLGAVALALYGLNRSGERPYRWWSVLFLPVAGLLSMGMHLAVEQQQWLVYLLGGVWLLAEGAWTLLWYLYRNPSPRKMEDLHA